MTEFSFEVKSQDGLHARPAGIIAKTAALFKSNVEIAGRGQKKNAKSILSIMSLGLLHHDFVTLTASGEDAEIAIAKLQETISDLFAKTN